MVWIERDGVSERVRERVGEGAKEWDSETQRTSTDS